jgi:hypothetical protein
MNVSADFMPPKPKRPAKPRKFGKTVGVHIPDEKDYKFLLQKMEAEYRSASEIMYLLIRRERENFEGQNPTNN